HAAGDQLLARLARLVEENIRKGNTFGRFGGEEFLLLLPDTSAEQALIVAEKIRYLIAHHEFEFASRQPLGHLTVSGGIAAFPDHGVGGAELLRAADEALYEAKHQGRNRVLSGRARDTSHRSKPTTRRPLATSVPSSTQTSGNERPPSTGVPVWGHSAGSRPSM